jgi:hypothetical protein
MILDQLIGLYIYTAHKTYAYKILNSVFHDGTYYECELVGPSFKVFSDVIAIQLTFNAAFHH